MASSSEASCISDPNFAVICAFLERFATSCGITYPPFLDLQEMLENVDHVPQELIDLHIKLLRKARKSVAIEKWEKALIKFCHTYSLQDGWEIERFGYKKSRLEVKLRALKTLLEGQFDLNCKFKAEVNTIASDELRSKPLGKDKEGRIYWLQFDPSSNIRVYREDLDEESWTLVAKDRTSLVQLLQELSGKENPIDLNALNDDSTSITDKPTLDTGQSSNSSVKNEEIPLDESSLKNGDVSGALAAEEEKDPLEVEEGGKQDENVKEDPVEKKSEVKNEQQNNSGKDGQGKKEPLTNREELVKTSVEEEKTKKHPIEEKPEPAAKKIKLDGEVSEAITEPVMLINGEGNGEECQTGNIELGETIEDPVMFFYGEGTGEDCLTGNPDKDNERTEESEKSENTCNSQQNIVQPPPVEPLELKKSETETKPAPKLWSIDTICGTSVNSNLETSVDVNNIDNQETDVKTKQKSFSSFSIDSVLEKKPVCESPKITINCPSDSISINNQERNVGEAIADVSKAETIERLQDENEITVESPKCNNEQSSEVENDAISEEEIKPNELLIKSDNDTNILCENVEVKELGKDLEEVREELSTEEVKEELKLEAKAEPELEEQKIEPRQEETKTEHLLEEAKAEPVPENAETKPVLEEAKAEPVPEKSEPKPVLEEAKAEPVIDEAKAEPILEETKAEPAPEKAETKSVLEKAKAEPVPKKSEPKPVLEEAKAEPVIDEAKAEPILEETKAEPAPEKAETKSVLEKAKAEPVPKKAEAKPVLEEAKAEPEIDEAKAEPTLEETKAEPAPEKAETKSVLEKAKAEPIPEKAEAKPVLEEAKVEPVPENAEAKSVLEESKVELVPEKAEAKPVVEEAKAKPVLEEAEAKPVVEETKAKPVLEEAKAEHRPEETKVEPVLEETNEESRLDKEKAEPVLEEQKVEHRPEEAAAKPELEDAKSEPRIEEAEPRLKGAEVELKAKSEEPKPEPESQLVEAKEETKPEVEKAQEPKPEWEEPKSKEESEPEPTPSAEDTKAEPEPEPESKPEGKEERKPEPEKTSILDLKEPNESSASDKNEESDLREVVTRSEAAGVENSKCDKLETEGKSKNEVDGPPQEISNSEESKDPEKEKTVPGGITQKSKTEEKVEDASANDKDEAKTEKDEESQPRKILLRNRKGSSEDPKSVTPTKKKKKSLKKKKRGKGESKEPKKNEDEEEKEDEEEVENEIPVDGANTEEVDPLALNNEENETQPENIEGTEKKESPKKSRKRRSTTTNSISDDGGAKQEEEEEGGGGKKMKMKMRGKKLLDAKIRKSVEEKRERRESSSEEESKEKDEKKDEDEEEKTPKKKGRPKKDEEGKGGSRPIASREMKLLGITSDMDLELPSIRQSRRIATLKLKEEAERRRLEEERLEAFKSKDKKKKKDKKKGKKDESDGNYDEEGDDSEDEEEKLKKKQEKKRKKKEKLQFNERNPWKSSSGSSSSSSEEDEDDDEEHEEEELFKSDHEFSPESDVEDPDYKPMKRARTAQVEKDDKDDKGTGKYDDTSCEKCRKNDHPEWILLCDKCDKGWHASCVHPVLMLVPEGDWFCPPCEQASLITKLQESLVQYDRSQKQRENEELRKKRLAFVGISLDNVLPTKKEKKRKHRKHGEEDDEDDEDDDDEAGDNDKDESASASRSGSSSDSSSSGETTSDESDEPVYQLRERRSNVTSYRYSEYDELIKSALQEEVEAVKGAGNAGKGKDISNIINAEEPEVAEPVSEKPEEVEGVINGDVAATPVEGRISAPETQEATATKLEEKEEKGDGDSDGEDEDNENGEAQNEEEPAEELLDEIPPVVPRYDKKKKKSKSLKVTSLEFTSDEENDDTSDSDFKGSSDDEESDYSLPSESESSDGIRKKRKNYDGPVRRSTRARIARYDRDFINDDTDDEAPRRKKSRNLWASESESSDSDRSWGRKKKRGGGGRPKRRAAASRTRTKSKTKSKPKKKRSKKRIVDSDNDDFERTIKKPKNRKIKYGGLDDASEAEAPSRRTRGRKINYQEMNPSDDSSDGIKPRVRPMKIDSDDDFVAEKEKEAELKEAEESEEEESDDVDDNDNDNSAGEDGFPKKKNKENGEKDKKKKNKNVIPDPDDFSENDLMEDEELDEFAEELEDLDEEEEEILGEMLKEGDVPVHELKSAVKNAKEKRKLKKLAEINANKSDLMDAPPPYPPIPAHLENPGSGPKFQKIGKMKITPSRSELAMAAQFSANPDVIIPPQLDDQGFRGPEVGDPVGGLLLKTLQGDPSKPLEPGIPLNPNIPLKEDSLKLQHLQQPYPPQFVGDPLVSNLSRFPPGIIPNQPPPGMLPMLVGNGPHGPLPLPQYNTFQDMISPLQRMPVYPPTPNLPTTVAGISNLNTLAPDPRKKSGPKQSGKSKRKSDGMMSPGPDTSEESTESGERLPTPQMEDFMKGAVPAGETPPKRKGRGRGKKQLLAEAQAQAQAQVQGKQDVTIATVQAPTQFPPQGITPDAGSVITRMLNTPQGPQTFPGGDAFSANQRGRPPPGAPGPPGPPFRPTTPSNFPGAVRPPANLSSPMQLRAPPPGGLYHTSHPLDPSPSGGGPINIPVTNPGISKPSPPPSFRGPAPGQIPPILPRFPINPGLRPPQGSPPTENFPGFPPNFYGSFPQPPPGPAGDPLLPNPPYPDQFDDGHVPDGANPKPFDDETGGEFGGLASYFASQREDDLDT